ncbi:MAG: response regulator transcription factor [Rhodomicrobium sp.]
MQYLDLPSFTSNPIRQAAMKVLVVEDDPDSGTVLALGLAEHGHDAECATACAQAIALAEKTSFDAMIVDRGLPDGDGLNAVEALRAQNIMTPVIFLTALGDVSDRIDGLRAGGDDYLIKPFSFPELIARLEAVTRRNHAAPQTLLRVGDLEMDLIAATVKRSGNEIALQPREFRLLEVLMRNAGQTVTRSMLLEGVWKFQVEPGTKILEVQMSRLRQKIDQEDSTPLIHTIRGSGYCIRAD